MCQRQKARGNKLSPLSWAHRVGGLYRLKVKPMGFGFDPKVIAKPQTEQSPPWLSSPLGFLLNSHKKSFLSASCHPFPKCRILAIAKFLHSFQEHMGRSLQFTCTLSGACRVLTAPPNPRVWPWSPSRCTCSTCECLECTLHASDLLCTRGGGGLCVVRKLHVF